MRLSPGRNPSRRALIRSRNKETEHDVVRKPITLFGIMLQLRRNAAAEDPRKFKGECWRRRSVQHPLRGIHPCENCVPFRIPRPSRTAQPIWLTESNRTMRGRKPEDMMRILMEQFQGKRTTVFRPELRKKQRDGASSRFERKAKSSRQTLCRIAVALFAPLGQQARKSAKRVVGRLTRADMPVPRAVICSLAAMPRLRWPFVARTGSMARRRVSNPQCMGRKRAVIALVPFEIPPKTLPILQCNIDSAMHNAPRLPCEKCMANVMFR